jgi:hypothetical protein
MASLTRGLAVVLLLTTLVVPALPAAAEADMAGGWTVEFALPWGGSASYPMWVNQNGKTLTGRVTFPGVAEYQIKGTIDTDRFTIVWQTVVDGEFLDVTFAGRVAGDEMNGTAKIGKYSERELYGRRTER